MASLPRTKSLTIFLVVCYALAVTVSGLFHNHGSCERCCPPVYDGGSGEVQPTCSCEHQHHESTSPTHQKPKAESKETSGKPHFSGQPQSNSGICPVCSFLAQKTVTSDDLPEIAWTKLEKACVPKLPLAPALPFLYSWHGRAPPVAF